LVDITYKQEVRVGLLVLVGFIVFTGFMFWLTGRSLVSKAIAVHVVFKDVSGLKEGDPVRVSGVKKGRVGPVRLQRVGHVTVTLELDPEVRPHKDARATVASADFLGAKYVDYDPGVSDTILAATESIQGLTEEQFADVAQGAARSAQELISNVNKGLNPGQLAEDIHNTLIATQRGMNALTQATNGPAIQQTQATLKALERVMTRLDTLLGNANVARSGNRLDTLSANLTQLTRSLSDATGSLKGLLDKMDKGEGTLGKMATDTLLYKNLNATLKSLSELLTDLKERPGRYLTVKVF
jgi:phospholipid/cholesterol/gamma-HCH transport system substrate-binding protein